MDDPSRAAVYLVGAGPGDPGLLTLRGAECLALADLVIYDKLVSPRLLDYAPPKAERLCVNEWPGCHPERWGQIHQAMIDAARQGRTVVRLKGGDPLLFGRGGEEAQALREAGITYQIVPGVTSSFAAAACTDIPLTHREHSSAIALVTGHEIRTKGNGLDWSAIAQFPGTLALYMGMARLHVIARELLAAGKPPETPTAVVHMASTGFQQSLTAPLGEIADRVRAEGIQAPAIILIGNVVKLKPPRSWFESRPLFGARVLVTRPARQATAFVRQLELLGAAVFTLPAVEIRDPQDWSAVDAAILNLPTFDWLVFTSPNGVESFFSRLMTQGHDVRRLGRVQLAVVGPGTAETLRRFHLSADVIAEPNNSEGLVAALRPRVAGQRVLLARADRGIDLLRQELGTIAQVEQIAVYAQVDALLPGSTGPLFDSLRRGEIGYITLTSSNIARSLLSALDETTQSKIGNGNIRLVTISPRTSAVVRELGFPVAAEAEQYNPQGVLTALCELVARELSS